MYERVYTRTHACLPLLRTISTNRAPRQWLQARCVWILYSTANLLLPEYTHITFILCVPVWLCTFIFAIVSRCFWRLNLRTRACLCVCGVCSVCVRVLLHVRVLVRVRERACA